MDAGKIADDVVDAGKKVDEAVKDLESVAGTDFGKTSGGGTTKRGKVKNRLQEAVDDMMGKGKKHDAPLTSKLKELKGLEDQLDAAKHADHVKVSAKQQKKINRIEDYFKKKGMDPDNLDMTKLKGNDRKMAKHLDKAKVRSTRHLEITK